MNISILVGYDPILLKLSVPSLQNISVYLLTITCSTTPIKPDYVNGFIVHILNKLESTKLTLLLIIIGKSKLFFLYLSESCSLYLYG